MKLLVLFAACFLLVINTDGALSSSSKGNKPSAASDETAEMLCNVLVQASKELIRDSSVKVNLLKDYLRQDCLKLPKALNLVQKCQAAVDTYVVDIVDQLEMGTDLDKICPLIQGREKTSLALPLPKSLNITPNQTCVLCEFVLHLVQTFATANTSAQELANILENICQIMPTVLSSECKNFIETYGIDIIALLLREFDPPTVCEKIKLCPKQQNVQFLSKPNQNTCGLCDYVETYLSAGYPKEKACQYFSTDNNVKQQCEVLVQLYKPGFCPQLQICKEVPNEIDIGSPQCTVCKFVVNYIENIIQNNKSAAAVEAALEKVCSIVPGPLKTECDKFVTTYGPILALLLAKYNTSLQVCNALKVCNNGTETPMPVVPQFDLPTVKSAECLLCKLVVTYLEIATQNNKSAAAIEAALEKVCSIVPATLKTKCDTFVKTSGPILAILLAKYNDTVQVCNALKACNNGTETPMPELNLITLKSAECSLCKYIISYIDTVIQNNKSEAAIEAALEKVCSILPTPLHAPCKTFVDTYGPILVKLLEKYTTPDQVCNALKVCNNGTQVVLPKIQEPSVKSAECSLCKYIITYIDTVIQNNKSEAAIEAALEKVCTILPAALKAPCKTFVDTYGPILVQLLEKYTTPDQVCDALKLCNNGTQSIMPVVSPKLESVECSLCKYIVGYVEHVIESNKTEAAVEVALEKVCTILPSDLKPKCENFVDTYGPILFKLIEKLGTADAVCKALKLCLKEAEVTTPVLALPKIDSSAIRSAECSLCKYIVSYVDSVIQNNKSEAAIEAALEKVCTILPAPAKAPCKTFVDTYGPILVQLLEKYTTPEQVCDALKLCNNGTVVLQPLIENIPTPRKVQKRSLDPLQTIGASVECALCQFVINYLDNVIQNNKSEAAIEAALDQVCKILPAALQDKCKQFVNIYGPVIPQLIIHYGTPTQVCNALKACNNGTQAVAPSPREILQSLKSVGNDVECSLCKYVLNYINVLISSNASAQEVEKALELVCGILPSSYHKQCNTFVLQYGPVLAQLVAELDDPNVVCEWLSLCTKSNGKFIELPVVKKGLKTLPCNLCQYVVNYLDVIVKSNATETDFEKALDQACDILPGKTLQGECQTLVNLYGPAMINFLVEHGDPKTVCQRIGICDK